MALTASTSIVAATNRGLGGLVERKQFRADLFYRLAGVDIPVPALRERRDDILELARYFLERHKARRPLHLSAAAADALVTHDWPGNVRELERLIERAVALASSDVIELEDLPAPLWRDLADIVQPSLERNETMRAWAARYAHLMVARCGGRRSEAARTLGISYHTLKGHLNYRRQRPPCRLAERRNHRSQTCASSRSSPGVSGQHGGRDGAAPVGRCGGRACTLAAAQAAIKGEPPCSTCEVSARSSVKTRLGRPLLDCTLLCGVGVNVASDGAESEPAAPNAVERLDAAAPARPLNPADRGATYRWLDERAFRVTTTFVDAVLVTERIPEATCEPGSRHRRPRAW